jgi:hypothetical protein
LTFGPWSVRVCGEDCPKILESNIMQLPGDGDDLKATFFCKDPDSHGADECETFYRTDRDSWLVQGKKRGPSVAAQLLSLSDDETFAEVSGPTVELFVWMYVKERYGIDLGRAADGVDLGGTAVPEAGVSGQLRL